MSAAGADNWADATPINLWDVSDPTPVAPLTSEPGEQYDYSGCTAWWQFTPTDTGLYVLDTLLMPTDSGIEMQIFTGDSLAGLTLIATQLGWYYDYRAVCVIELTAGTTYYVQLDTWNGTSEHDYILQVRTGVTSDWQTTTVNQVVTGTGSSYNTAATPSEDWVDTTRISASTTPEFQPQGHPSATYAAPSVGFEMLRSQATYYRRPPSSNYHASEVNVRYGQPDWDQLQVTWRLAFDTYGEYEIQSMPPPDGCVMVQADTSNGTDIALNPVVTVHPTGTENTTVDPAEGSVDRPGGEPVRAHLVPLGSSPYPLVSLADLVPQILQSADLGQDMQVDFTDPNVGYVLIPWFDFLVQDRIPAVAEGLPYTGDGQTWDTMPTRGLKWVYDNLGLTITYSYDTLPYRYVSPGIKPPAGIGGGPIAGRRAFLT